MQALELLQSRNPKRNLAITANDVHAPNGVGSGWSLLVLSEGSDFSGGPGLEKDEQ